MQRTPEEIAAEMELPAESVHFGAEYVPFLKDRKIAFIRLEGTAFGGTPLELELRMCVEDSPSAAGNVLDAVRYMKFAMDRGIAGVVDPVSSLLMKATPRPMSEPAALAELSSMIDQPRTSRRHRGLRTEGHDRSPQET